MAKIVILGSGGFGLALAIMAEHCGKHDVTVWSKFQSEIDDIRSHGEHVQKLPHIAHGNQLYSPDVTDCFHAGLADNHDGRDECHLRKCESGSGDSGGILWHLL